MEMPVFVPASPLSQVVFLVIVGGVIASFLTGVSVAYGGHPSSARRVTGMTALGLTGWLGLVVLAVGSGWIARLPLGGFPVFFGGVLVVSAGVALSPLGARLATLPLGALVAFQTFRLPLELVLHTWAAQGTIPETMTWSGQNWDIVSGVVALAIAPWAGRSRALAWTANLVGAGLLLNVMRVAAMSSPVPFGWGVTPPLLLAWYLPYALVGPVCVGGALAGHIVLTRALLGKPSRS